MPIVLTFDLQNYEPNHHSYLRSALERLGWQNLGGTSFRYPKLGSTQPVEDWFNYVIPALMLVRAYASKYPGRIAKFTLDTQSSSGYDPAAGYGNPPLKAMDFDFKIYPPTVQQFGEKKLIEWIDAIDSPTSTKVHRIIQSLLFRSGCLT